MKNTSRQHLAEIIAEKTLHNFDKKKLSQEIAAYLLSTGETQELESLIRDIIEYRATKGVVEAIAVSAHPLDNKVIKELESLVKQEYSHVKSVKVDQELDPQLIGGVRLELPGEELDTTVRTRLNTFKRLTAQERN